METILAKRSSKQRTRTSRRFSSSVAWVRILTLVSTTYKSRKGTFRIILSLRSNKLKSRIRTFWWKSSTMYYHSPLPTKITANIPTWPSSLWELSLHVRKFQIKSSKKTWWNHRKAASGTSLRLIILKCPKSKEHLQPRSGSKWYKKPSLGQQRLWTRQRLQAANLPF